MLHPTTCVLFALTKLVNDLYPNVQVPVFELCEFVKDIQRESDEDGYDPCWMTLAVDSELEAGVSELVIGSPLVDKMDGIVRDVAARL
jgi:hypothetical protein